MDDAEIINQTVNLASDLYAWRVAASGKSMAQPPPLGVDQDALEKVEAIARRELQQQKVKSALCAVLRSTRDDLRSVAQVVAAALLPLTLAGTISLPATPLALAAAALIVFNAGVARYCEDHQQSPHN